MKTSDFLQRHTLLSKALFQAGTCLLALVCAFGLWNAWNRGSLPSAFPRDMDLVHDLAQRGELDAALRGLKISLQTMGDPDQAQALIELAEATGDLQGRLMGASFLAIHHPSTENHIKLGDAQRALGQRAEAERSYAEAIRLSHSAPAEALLGMAALHEASGEWDKAFALYQQVLARDPAHPEALAGYAGFLRRGGRAAEAIQVFERVITLDPDNIQALNNLGILLAEQGRLDEAAQSFQKALAVQPANPRTHGNLARVFAMMGKSSESAYHQSESERLEGQDREKAPSPTRSVKITGPMPQTY